MEVQKDFVIKEISDSNTDTITIWLVDVKTKKPMAHLTFTAELYIDSLLPTEPQELLDILEDYDYVLSLDYISTELEYCGNGLAEFLMKYFCNKYVGNKPCILICAPYGHKKSSEKILQRFYAKYGFKKISNNSAYMVKNIL